MSIIGLMTAYLLQDIHMKQSYEGLFEPQGTKGMIIKMEKDLLSLIKSESAGFSKGKKQIAKYIEENYDKAAFMTAGRLGKTVGVSESTVVRFAADLGYDGYPEMRKTLQEIIRNRLTSVQRIEVANDIINSNNLLAKVLRSDIENMQSTLNNIDQDDFISAADAIRNANHVYIVGMRSSSCLASFMGYYMNLVRENVHIVSDTSVSEIFDQVIRTKKGDAFVAISYPRYCTRTIKAMEYAKATGATVIGITDSHASPLVGIADIKLLAKSDMVAFLDSLVAPLSVINALVVSVSTSSGDVLFDTFRRLETIWSENKIYERSND